MFRKGYHPTKLITKQEKRKPKTTWFGNIIQWTDMDLERIVRVTYNGSQWRRMIHGAVNPRIEDD